MAGEELRGRRQSQKLTQSAMGEKLGVRANTVARWERDELPIPHWVPLLLDCYDKQQAGYTGGIAAFHTRLRKEITRRRKLAGYPRYKRRYDADSMVRTYLAQLIDWVEGELGTSGIQAAGTDASLAAAYRRLQNGIAKRKQEAADRKAKAKWYPAQIGKLEVAKLIDWIEAELDTIMRPKP